MPEPDRGFTVRPELLEKFPRQFAGALALYDFNVENRPGGPPTDDFVGHLILWIYVRGAKTYGGSIRLAAAGFGEQAGMLNRSLFEDMALAHWAKLNPEDTLRLFRNHERYHLARFRTAIESHERLEEVGALPALSDDERKELQRQFRASTWAGRDLTSVIRDIEHEWPSPQDRTLLWQFHDIVHLFNNMLIHQSAISLNLAGDYQAGRIRFTPGPSSKHIHGALAGAFWAYVNLASLVFRGETAEALGELYVQHLEAFTSARHAPPEGA